jgi:hypothetical protein
VHKVALAASSLTSTAHLDFCRGLAPKAGFFGLSKASFPILQDLGISGSLLSFGRALMTFVWGVSFSCVFSVSRLPLSGALVFSCSSLALAVCFVSLDFCLWLRALHGFWTCTSAR